MNRSPLLLLPCLLLLLLGVGCDGAVPRQGLRVEAALPPAPAASLPVVLPTDDAPHRNLSEWWYYTGHLETGSRRRYGFELVVFQAVRGQNPVGYAAHFAVTDHQRRTFSYEQLAERALRPQGEGRYQLAVGGWQMGGEGDRHYLQAEGKGYAVDLKLDSLKPPVLHNGTGWISFGPAGDSYYYSRTRMEVSGTMRDEAGVEPVSGLVWMDHQWGDFILVDGGGWDWFSLQLSDGSDVMVTVLRDQPGNVAATYGSFVDELGEVADLKAKDIQVQATGTWGSPRGGAIYPSGWSMRLPRQGLELVLRPVLLDQELNTTETTGVSYWEGDVDVTGTRDGQPVTGGAYVELTGYAR